MIAGVLVFGIAATYLPISIFRGGRVEYTALEQMELGFTARSDYFEVVNKLGKPTAERWKSAARGRFARLNIQPRA